MLKFNNRYLQLPGFFYSKKALKPFPEAKLFWFNEQLSAQLSHLNYQDISNALETYVCGKSKNLANESIALAYAGHQFGHFVSSLGDGRALVLGQMGKDQVSCRDIQLKGSGPTAFSRGGDGFSPLGPVIRELLVSEAMHHLGIPTTRTLGAFKTQRKVMRHREEPGGILVRSSKSLLRVGSFEYAASRKAWPELIALINFAMKTDQDFHLETDDKRNPYVSYFSFICQKQASLIAQWTSIGFIHGVMNTDNMAISGETIDYGPCAFLDSYKPDSVFSSIDRGARYAFNKQSQIAQWNLYILAICLLPILQEKTPNAEAQLQEEIENFKTVFEYHWLDIMSQKIGISKPKKQDTELIHELLRLLASGDHDYTLCFRYLSEYLRSISKEKNKASKINLTGKRAIFEPFSNNPKLQQWKQTWHERISQDYTNYNMVAEQMDRINPIIIPRNHLIARAIQLATEDDDFGFMKRLNQALSHPFDMPNDKDLSFILPPSREERVVETFCGT